MVLERGGVKKCGMPDVLVFFEFLFLWALGGEMRYIRFLFCCLREKVLFDVEILVVLFRCYSLYGRSDFAGCSAAAGVGLILKGP